MARKVIVAVTDAKKGAARVTADKEGYKSFIIPDNVGKPVKQIVEPELIDINESGVRVDDTIEFAVRFGQGVTVLTSAFIGLIKLS